MISKVVRFSKFVLLFELKAVLLSRKNDTTPSVQDVSTRTVLFYENVQLPATQKIFRISKIALIF